MSDTVLTARRAQTRERILDAATRIFAHKGVPAATVEEICEGAGFTRGAFYSNFDSKDELCLAVFRRFAKETEDAARAAVATVPRAFDSVRVKDVVDNALTVMLTGVVAAPARVLAALEIRLYFLRNPQLDKYRPDRHEADLVFAKLLEDELSRAHLGLRLPSDQTVDLLNCVLESHTIKGSGIDIIRRRMGDVLDAMIIRREGCTTSAGSDSDVT